MATYPIYLIPHKDGPLALVAPGPGPALEGGARPLTAPRMTQTAGRRALDSRKAGGWPHRMALVPDTYHTYLQRQVLGQGQGHGYGQEQAREQGPGQEQGLPVTLNLPSRDRGGSLWAVGARFPSGSAPLV